MPLVARRLDGVDATSKDVACAPLHLGWLLAALLCALFAFSNTLANGFVFDDHFLIENNPSLADRSYLSRVFTPAQQDSPVREGGNMKASFVAYYRPFTRALFAINYQVFGLDSLGWHAINLGLYLIVITLSFLLLSQLVPSVEVYGPATLLFALHPIHSEAVSWANCLVETLHGLFFLTALLLFVRARKAAGWTRIGWQTGSLLAATAAIFCKETAVSLSLLVAGYLFFIETQKQSWWTRLRSSAIAMLPYLSVILFYLLLRYRAAGGSLEIGAANRLDVTLHTLPAVLVKYLRLLILPIDLSPAYPIRPVASFTNMQFLLPLLLLLVLAALIVKYLCHEPAWRMGWLLLLVPLLPVLNVGMLLPEMLVQDRYLFLPALGFCLIGGLLYTRLPEAGRVPRRALLLLILTCYGVLAIRQNSYWRDDQELFTYALKIDPKSSFAHINLAAAYLTAGDLTKAAREYTEALRYNPECAICYANIADINYTQGDYHQGVAFYREAIRSGYRDTIIWHSLAVGLLQIGEIAQGIEAFQQVVALEPTSSQAQINLAQAYLLKGDTQQAIERFEQALVLERGNAENHFLLGLAYERANQSERARAEYAEALNIDPGHRKAKEGRQRLAVNP
ncbi:MAG: tetratricopeptide repeat protein [Acidobacteriota bacterium]